MNYDIKENHIVIDRYTDEEDIWRDAWRIAEPGASNPVGVARTLLAASSFLLYKLKDTDSVKKHPALRVMAGQLAMLYNVNSIGADGDDYNRVQDVVDSLEAGNNLDQAFTDAGMKDKS